MGGDTACTTVSTGCDVDWMGVHRTRARSAKRGGEAPLPGFAPALRNERRWRTALAADARVHVVTANFHATDASYGHWGRSLDQHICNLLLSGSMVAVVNGGRHLISAGDALWMDPDVVHDFILPAGGTGFTMLNLRFRIEQGGHLLASGRRFATLAQAWDLRPLWELVIDDVQHRRGDAAERCRHVLALLDGEFQRHRPADDDAAGLGRHRRLALMAWLSTRHHLRPDSRQLAGVVGLSEDWFRRIFRRTFHCSPRTWVLRQRIQRAARDLADQPGLSVADLAQRYGYEDHRLFDRQFRQVLGRSPRQWLLG